MTETQHDPASGLARELKFAHELLECLQQEQAHLIQADIAALAACAERKDGIVGRMNALAAARMQALTGAGHPATEAGWPGWRSSRTQCARPG